MYKRQDNDCACTPAGKAPEKTRPIGRYNVRSFITSLADGARVATVSYTHLDVYKRQTPNGSRWL